MDDPKPLQARQTHIDALKCLAAQCIVLHHFASYGPLSQGLHAAAPELASWLYNEALMAVHVFLALGGFLAARSLCSQGERTRPWGVSVAERLARLLPPYAAALLLAMLCSAVARHWLSDDFIPPAPSVWQVLAHLGLVHDIVGVDALTAGAWYVAMDFHLYALLALMLGRGPRMGPAMVVSLAAASVLVFNRNPELDEWAVYFFGSYGLGAAAWAASRSTRAHGWLAALALLGLLALALEFRERLLLALATALLLGLWERHQNAPSWTADEARSATRLQQMVAQQGASSFALFLLHFPVLLLASAGWSAAQWSSPTAAVAVLVAAWLASVLGAMAFHRWVEQTLGRWVRPLMARLVGLQPVRMPADVPRSGVRPDNSP